MSNYERQRVCLLFISLGNRHYIAREHSSDVNLTLVASFTENVDFVLALVRAEFSFGSHKFRVEFVRNSLHIEGEMHDVKRR